MVKKLVVWEGGIRAEDIDKGPWFAANFPGRCASCGDRYEEGDRIRADGEGGYECDCDG